MTPPTLTLVADELIYGRAACGCSPGPPVIGIRNARGVDGEAVEDVVIDRSSVTNQGQVRTPEFSSLVFVAVTWTSYLRQHHVIPLCCLGPGSIHRQLNETVSLRTEYP